MVREKPSLGQRNEREALLWIVSIEHDLTKVAAWTAHHVCREEQGEWVALERIANLHNLTRDVMMEWVSQLTANGIHSHCALQRLLPSTMPTYSIREVCCDGDIPEPPALIREAAAAAIAARNLPEGEGTTDPKKRYLVRYMLRTLLSNREKVQDEDDGHDSSEWRL